ncbi:MAG: hypothetical protein Q7U94_00755 [Sideroxyarcus sp.]|nr:hypothetical protein [Sideroxyarcus sp.]
MQTGTLTALLDHPERDELDFHVSLAGPLRSMLCDADWPTLLKLAEVLGESPRVWGPHAPSDRDKKAPTLYMNALTVSAEPVAFSQEMSIAEFLDAPVGAVGMIDQAAGKSKGHWYTPRQLIKWAANKDGPSHFDPKTPATYTAIATNSLISTGEVSMVGPGGETALTRSDNLPLRMALLQIAQASVIIAKDLLTRCSADI